MTFVLFYGRRGMPTYLVIPYVRSPPTFTGGSVVHLFRQAAETVTCAPIQITVRRMVIDAADDDSLRLLETAPRVKVGARDGTLLDMRPTRI